MSQLKAGAALSYCYIAINIIIGLLYTPFMLRILGQVEYGLYSLAASIVVYLTVLDLGFGNAVVRYTSKFKAEGKQKEQEEMFGMFFILYIAIGIIAFVAGSILTLNADTMFAKNMTPDQVGRMRIMLWLMTFNLAFTFPMSLWGSIMTAHERFVFQNTLNIIRSVLNPAVMVVLLFLGYKAIAMVVVTTIFNVSVLLVNFWYCRRILKIKVRFARFKWHFLKEIGIYSFWIFLDAIIGRIYWSTGQFVLGIYRSAVEIAIYAVAIQLTHIFMMFSTAISNLFLPKVTSLVTKGSSDKEISDLFIRTGRIQYIIIGFILSAFIVFGNSFIQIWAGKNYSEAFPITMMFFLALLTPLIQNLGITILQARNQMKFRSLCYLVIALGSLVFSVIGANLWGMKGCAIATTVALLLGQGIVMNVYYRQKQGLAIFHFWKEIIKMSIIPALVVLTSLLTIQYYNIDMTNVTIFIACAIIFVLIYIPLFWRFSMNQSEKDIVTKPLKRICHI